MLTPILGTNWKTNLAGVGVVVSTIGTIITQVADGTFKLDGTTIGGLTLIASIIWGFFGAKDKNVTGGNVVQFPTRDIRQPPLEG